MLEKMVLSLLLILVLSSCSFFQVLPQAPGEDQADPAVTSNATEEVIPQEEMSALPEANPLKIEMTLDATAVVEQEIGQEGGTLSVTGSDGTVYTLVIPTDALLSPELIRMVPATSITGLPFEDSAPAGVHLEPDGLIFFKAVTLKIQPATVQEGLIWVGFGTETDGQDFHLQPAVTQDNTLHILIAHFSDYGLARARKEEVGRLRDIYTPSDAQNYFVNQYGTISHLVDDPEARVEALTKALRDWYNYSVLVRINNAAVFDDRLDAAVGEFLAWSDMIETLDLFFSNGKLKENLRDEIEEGQDALATAFKNAFKKASDRCTSNNDPDEAFRMRRYGLAAEHMQLWGRSGLDESEARDMLKACFKFDFLFRSKVVVETDNGTKISQVMARIPLDVDKHSVFSSTGGSLIDVGDLIFEINTLSNLPDFCQLNGTPGKMAVLFIYNLNYSKNLPWTISDVKVKMFFRVRPEESITCTTPGGTISNLLLIWRPFFQQANQGFFGTDMAMTIGLPKVKKGEIYAEMELYGQIADVPNSDERSTYQLIHTP